MEFTSMLNSEELQCPLCNFTGTGLVDHINTEHKMKIEVEDTMIENNEAKEEPQFSAESNGKLYQCHNCGEIYNGNHTFYQHVLKNHSAKWFKCEHCEKKYVSQDNLKVHIEEYHKFRLEPFECKICNKTYERQTPLRRHLLEFHKEQKRTVPCPFCPRTFVYKGLFGHILSKHSTTQTTDKLIECKICMIFLKSRENYKQHIKKYHLNGQEYSGYHVNIGKKPLLTLDGPVQCDECHQVFSCRIVLKTHLKTHQTVKLRCSFCYNLFFSQKALNLHLLKNHKIQVTANETTVSK